MARLIYVINISLDGYISDREGSLDWTEMTAEVFPLFNDLVRPVGTYLYGRRTYEMMALWETAHLEPGAPAFMPGLGELEREFATLWRATDKVVFSTTLPHASTPRTRIERAVDPDQIRQLKATSERDITVGGPKLAASMLAANLVDDLHAVIHPVILGGGSPWLPPDVRTKLELASARRLGGVAHLHYRTARAGVTV
jgi:dihydrofolate reductase